MIPEIPDIEAENVLFITLPFPPSSLSGHAKGNWRKKYQDAVKYRTIGKTLTLEAMRGGRRIFGKGDIPIHFRFYPPDRRSDRVNMPARLKPLIDGIADALGVNDVRFLPSYQFCEPERPGRVEVEI